MNKTIDAALIQKLVRGTREKTRMNREDAFAATANELNVSHTSEEYYLAWEKFEEYRDFYNL